MGNTKSSVCMPMCGDKDDQVSLPGQKRSKFKKTAQGIQKFQEAKNSLTQILEEEAYQRYQQIRYVSPIDNCFTYLEKQLLNSNSDWATSLLYHYAGKMSELMDKKYKTYNWNIEVNLQDEVIKYEAIRECLSDSMKDEKEVEAHEVIAGMGSMEDLNASSTEEHEEEKPAVGSQQTDQTPDNLQGFRQVLMSDYVEDPFNYGASPIGKDGSMVLMKNSNIVPFQGQNFQFNSTKQGMSNQSNQRSQSSDRFLRKGVNYNEPPPSRPVTGEFPDFTKDSNADNVEQRIQIQEMNPLMSQQIDASPLDQAIDVKDIHERKVHTLEVKQTLKVSRLEKFKNFLENKKTNDLFKRKVRIIKRHFRNSQHPLRMLADLFSDELENIYNRSLKQRSDSPDIDSKSQMDGDLTRSQMLLGKNTRTQIKLSDREKESETQNQQKIKKFQQMQQIVKDFMLLLKHAIIRFYQIEYNKLRAFQKNYFTEKVKNLVLGYKVSKVLYSAAAEAHREEIIDFSKALNFLSNCDLDFYQVPPQFHLDKDYYIREMNRMKDTPIQIVQQNMEKTAFQFRMQKMNVNKSQLNAPLEVPARTESGNNTTANKKPIRLSEKGVRPVGIMMDLNKEMPNPFGGNEGTSENQKSEANDTEGNKAAPGSQNQDGQRKSVLSNDNISNSTEVHRLNRETAKRIRSYQKTKIVMQQLEKVTSLRKKRSIFIYSWKKLQKEVNDYWKDHEGVVPQHKLALCEDHRLCLMAFVIVQSQCADIYTSFLALNPFIDFNSMEEAVPMATVENAIQVIMKDFNDRNGPTGVGGDLGSCLEGGPIDLQSRLNFDLMSQHKILPSQMSDNMSFRSTNYMNQIEGFKRQIDQIKYRQSKIYQQSQLGFGASGVALSANAQGGIPIHQLCAPLEFSADDMEMNQEEEEEELHRRLNCSNADMLDPDDDNERFEQIKQRETFKRWQSNVQRGGLSFKHARNLQEKQVQVEQPLSQILRRSYAPTSARANPIMAQHPVSSLFLDSGNTRFDADNMSAHSGIIGNHYQQTQSSIRNQRNKSPPYIKQHLLGKQTTMNNQKPAFNLQPRATETTDKFSPFEATSPYFKTPRVNPQKRFGQVENNSKN